MNLPAFFKTFSILLFVSAGYFPAAYSQSITLNVLTYNIRYSNQGDAPNTWSQRKSNVYSVMREASPDVFGLQEALKEQVDDIENAFPGFARIGVGRDDGKESGEYSPLFYNNQKYNLLASGTFWLSQTPAIAGSRGWDAACNRVVTWIQLKEKNTGIDFLVFCTHFDHMGEVARRNSAMLILNAVDSLAGGKPAIVLGDFNALPESEPYHIITDNSNRYHMQDARNICKNKTGPEYTFTGFKVDAQAGEQIDYIFVKSVSHIVSLKVNPVNNGEYYPSDHLPVSAVIRIE